MIPGIKTSFVSHPTETRIYALTSKPLLLDSLCNEEAKPARTVLFKFCRQTFLREVRMSCPGGLVAERNEEPGHFFWTGGNFFFGLGRSVSEGHYGRGRHL